jgi:hypothetical protein
MATFTPAVVQGPDHHGAVDVLFKEADQHLLADARDELGTDAGACVGLHDAYPGAGFSGFVSRDSLEVVADADATQAVGVDFWVAAVACVCASIGADDGGDQRAGCGGFGVEALALVVGQAGAPRHVGADGLEGIRVAAGGGLVIDQIAPGRSRTDLTIASQIASASLSDHEASTYSAEGICPPKFM